MTQLSDDCFAFGGTLMSTDEALAELAQRVGPVVASETVPLAAALGRTIADDALARHASPPHDNAAVDGYALAFADLTAGAITRLPVTGRATAGHPFMGTAAGAVRIFTGAVMPHGTDLVVMQEDVTVDNDVVSIPPGLSPGANRRRAGEDFKAGDGILRRGARLRPQDVALAAAAGLDRLAVFEPVRVALFSTGDELREPGADLPPGAIHDANRGMLHGLLQRLGCSVTDIGILADDPSAVRTALGDAARGHDLLITSGGVSTGEEDHVKGAVEALGSLHFWRLAIKPGRPLAFGQVGGRPFIGLPGNPVAVMICFLRFARPVILRLGGAVDVEPRIYHVSAGFDHDKKPGRREWLRASLKPGQDGGLVAQKFSRQGSGVISSLVAADGLVEIPEQVTHVAVGDRVAFLPFNEVL